MPLIYNRSQAQTIITIARPIITTLTIEAFGSEDGYTTPGTDFGTDETIIVAGALVAADSANLTGVNINVYVDGVFIRSVALYGYDGRNNFYQAELGVLAEGTHTIETRFPRVRR